MITARINMPGKISARIQVVDKLTASMGAVVVVVEDISHLPQYDGPYEITPRVTAQTLPTARKILTDDLTVREIPRYDVSNTAGGKTIFIANEV